MGEFLKYQEAISDVPAFKALLQGDAAEQALPIGVAGAQAHPGCHQRSNQAGGQPAQAQVLGEIALGNQAQAISQSQLFNLGRRAQARRMPAALESRDPKRTSGREAKIITEQQASLGTQQA